MYLYFISKVMQLYVAIEYKVAPSVTILLLFSLVDVPTKEDDSSFPTSSKFSRKAPLNRELKLFVLYQNVIHFSSPIVVLISSI